jgi:hypothetical protein
LSFVSLNSILKLFYNQKKEVMAEIKIEKKKPVWPWIVALLIIGALIYYIFVIDHEANSENSVEIENTTSTQ